MALTLALTLALPEALRRPQLWLRATSARSGQQAAATPPASCPAEVARAARHRRTTTPTPARVPQRALWRSGCAAPRPCHVPGACRHRRARERPSTRPDWLGLGLGLGLGSGLGLGLASGLGLELGLGGRLSRR